MYSGAVLAGLLTCRSAGAFLSTLVYDTNPLPPRSTSRHHATYVSKSECAASLGVLSRVSKSRGRRRHLRHQLCPLRLSVGGRDEGTEAGSGEEGVSPGEGATANTSDIQGSRGDPEGRGAAGFGAHPAEDKDGVEEDSENEEGPAKEVEEEEDGGEPIYLPTGDSKDVRLFRAKLLAGSEDKWQEQLKRNVNAGQLAGQDAWAHELSSPEKGCLIIARSTMFSTMQTYFNQAVIFLASHDESGSAGFILNRPTTVSLGSLVKGNTLGEFHASPLYLGGDVGEGNVQIVHPYGPDKLPGAIPIIPGVFVGGAIDEANNMVAQGRANAEDFKFYLHLCGWGPGQLESEIKRGVWFAAACSSNVIMKHCVNLPVPMWREVMTLMGPKYGLLARDTYDDL